MHIALLAAIVLAVLQLLDLWSTHLFRSVGVREANPIFGPTFDRLPFWVAALAKLSLSALLIAAALLANDPFSQTVLSVATTLVAAWYLMTVLGNFRAWRQRKGR